MIAKPKNKRTVVAVDGTTQDIVDAIITMDSTHTERQTSLLSRAYEASYDGLASLFDWVHRNIRYEEDIQGVQDIRTPARLYADGVGDCKSMTLFITSVLKNLHIPYIIRFVSFGRSAPYTHVYPIAVLDGQNIPMDVVLGSFNKEPKYSHKKDYNMTQIAYLSGIPDSEYIAPLPTDADLTQLNTADALRWFMARQAFVAGMPEIGAGLMDGENETYRRYVHPLLADVAEYWEPAILPPSIHIAGYAMIGQKIRQGVDTRPTTPLTPAQQAQNQADYNAAMQEAANNDVRNWQQQLATASQVVPSWVQQRGSEFIAQWRTVVNDFLKTKLPSVAPALLGLFVVNTTNQTIIAKAAKQRAWVLGVANAIGIHPTVITASVALGILERYGVSPNVLLANPYGTNRIHGLGDTLSDVGASIPKVEAVTTLVSSVLSLTGEIVSFFQRDIKDIPAFTPDMVITAGDFGVQDFTPAPIRPNIPISTPPVLSPNSTPPTPAPSNASSNSKTALVFAAAVAAFLLFK